MYKDKLEKILMEDDVVSSIRNNFEELVSLIPEVKDMIGFEHKHPQHHLDVFEHTLLALSMAVKDFENNSGLNAIVVNAKGKVWKFNSNLPEKVQKKAKRNFLFSFERARLFQKLDL